MVMKFNPSKRKQFELKCEELIGKKCKIENRPCCLYCGHIRECYKNWKKGSYYCRVIKTDRWCSKVKKFLDDELPFEKD